MQIDIQVNTKEVERQLKNIPKKFILPSLTQAFNRVTRNGISSAVKQTAATLGVQQKAVRKRIRGGRRNARAFKGKLNTQAYFRFDYGLPISAIGKGQLKKVAVKDSFSATMASGKKSIWQRTGKPKKTPTQGSYVGRVASRGPRKGKAIQREPIEEVKLPMKQALPGAVGAYKRRVRKDLTPEFKRNLNRRLNAQAKKN